MLDRGHGALRRGRVSLENRIYFITACTDQRKPLLATDSAADLVFNVLRSREAASEIELIASVVMPDHVHCLVRLRDRVLLSTFMQRFRSLSAREVNTLLVRDGRVWQRGYFERRLRVDDWQEDILNYMWHNPSVAGTHFKCKREVWEWFRHCIRPLVERPEWLKSDIHSRS